MSLFSREVRSMNGAKLCDISSRVTLQGAWEEACINLAEVSCFHDYIFFLNYAYLLSIIDDIFTTLILFLNVLEVNSEGRKGIGK